MVAEISKKRARSRFGRWYHETFDDIFFRALIGPAQAANAMDGCQQKARDQWKRDLDNRKKYTRERRERERLAREAEVASRIVV